MCGSVLMVENVIITHCAVGLFKTFYAAVLL
jgi:hypothetical protein